MASISEMIQLAQFQQANKQANSPITMLSNLGVGVMQGMEKQQKKQNKDKLSQMITENTGKPGFGYELDEDGGMKITFDPSRNAKKSYEVGGKIVQFDPQTEETTVVYDPDENPLIPGSPKTPEEVEQDRENRERARMDKIESWDDVGGLGRLAAAATLSNTPEEKKLGKLRPGGILFPPATDKIVVKKPASELAPAAAPSYGKRQDGTEKGRGYFGEVQRKGGGISTELSIGVEVDGKQMDIPLLVPTMNQAEVEYLMQGGKPTKEMVNKAVAHAQKRVAEGKDPYAQAGEDTYKPLMESAPEGATPFRNQTTGKIEYFKKEANKWVKVSQ